MPAKLTIPENLQDPIGLAQAFMACPSVTPKDEGALGVLEQQLTPLGFACTYLPFEDTDTPPVNNLFARLGTQGPHFCFAGHSDVVPVGDTAAWTHPPFASNIADGKLWGRGACDMKGAISAFIAATAQLLATHGPPKGSISLMITGDEEGPAINGTNKMLPWMKANNQLMDVCLIGEPSNPKQLGDMIKIGRRGSLNAVLTMRGKQGHAAYPHLAHNPLPGFADALAALSATELDKGTKHFPPSNLEVVAVETPSMAFNVIPAFARARFNVRYNDSWTSQSLIKHITAIVKKSVGNHDHDLEFFPNGDWFLTKPNDFVDLVRQSITDVVGCEPELSTTGGTSDGRFIHSYAPVLEFGLLNTTAHHIDEHITIADLQKLTHIYRTILERYFGVS